MRKVIAEKLTEIALKENIDILFACESGSRAWGFPSPDSDYDIRFIYKRKKNDYLSVTNMKDHLSFPIVNDLDMYGWDIRKVLQLMLKSNCTPYEWLQSPIIYFNNESFVKDMMDLFPDFFCASTQTNHYLGIARGAAESLKDGKIKIKKMFYILRPLLAARWISLKMTYPPMNIEKLLLIAPPDIQQAIESLILQKSERDESFLLYPNELITDFVMSEMNLLNQNKFLPCGERMNKEKLNSYFRQCIEL